MSNALIFIAALAVCVLYLEIKHRALQNEAGEREGCDRDNV